MNSLAIGATFVGACAVWVATLVAHRRLAGAGERPGLLSMLAFVMSWLAGLTALITGLFLVFGRSAS